MMANQQEGSADLFLVSNGEILISSVKPNTYGFTCSFTNNGNTGIEPEVEAVITDSARINTIAGLAVSGTTKRLLPLQAFRPNGEIDISRISDGVYVLELTLKAGAIGETKTAGIRVTTVNKIKKLTLVAAPKTLLAPAGKQSPPTVKSGGAVRWLSNRREVADC